MVVARWHVEALARRRLHQPVGAGLTPGGAVRTQAKLEKAELDSLGRRVARAGEDKQAQRQVAAKHTQDAHELRSALRREEG